MKSKKQSRNQWEPEQLVTFDIETEGWDTVVSIGWYDVYRDEYNSINTGDVEDPVEYFVDNVLLTGKYISKRFVAHNGGNFDFGFIIPHLIEKEKYEVQMLKRGNGDIFYIKVSDNREHTWHLQDSLALLPRSLDYLADAYSSMENEEFTEDEYDRINGDWEAMEPEFREKLQSYLENDCKILADIIRNFSNAVGEIADGNRNLNLTIGSTTMGVYQAEYMKDDVREEINQTTRELENKIRESYYAGRTEIFRMKGRNDDYPLYYFDINSLYPHCYTNYPVPTGKPVHTENEEMIEEYLWDETYGGSIYINGEVPEDVKYPVLPRRVETEDGAEKVVFATGEVEGWYMLREVRYALENGFLEVDEFEEIIVSENEQQFREYGDQLYTLKQGINGDVNPGKYETVKLLLNSFYGKFAMDRSQSEIRIVDDVMDVDEPWEPVGNEHTQRDMINNGVISVETETDAGYILPRIASAITAQARIELHKWMMRCIDAGGKIYYSDTDSIVTDVDLRDHEPSEGEWVNEELGGMDLEHIVSEYIALRPKTYAILDKETGEETIKGKGMRGIEDEVCLEDYKESLENEDPGRIECSWEGVRGLNAVLKEDPEKIVKTREFSRSLTGFDDKRNHTEDGLDSFPLRI